MWRDALLDQPVQHRSRPVSGIPDKPLRLETKALLRSLNHGPRRSDLGLANGAGGLDVNDDGCVRRRHDGFVLDKDTVCGRPAGIAVTQDGALLVSDDANGTIFRITHRSGS